MIRRPNPIVETGGGPRERSETSMHTFAVYVEDQPGVLNRVASLFRRRGFNIDSLTVGHTEPPGVSRMTIVVADRRRRRAADRGAPRQADAASSASRTSRPPGGRARSRADQGRRDARGRAAVMQLVEVFRARVVDVAPGSLIVEITGVGGQDRRPGRSAAAVRRAGDGAHRTRRDGPRLGAPSRWPRSARRDGDAEDGVCTACLFRL